MSRAKQFRPRFPAGIVVGVDEQGHSDHAVRMGLELSQSFSARVDLVHAFHAPPDSWPGIDPLAGARMTAEIRSGARRLLEEHVCGLIEGTDQRSGPVGVLAARQGTDVVAIVDGPPARVLLEEARRRRAGLILLGAHRKREPLDLGGTLRAVFAKSTIPVWVQPGPVRPIRRILAAIDLYEESLSALATGCAIAKVYGARVHAVHCFDGAGLEISAALGHAGAYLPDTVGEVSQKVRADFERAMEEFDWGGVEREIELAEGSAVERLLDLTASADLLVIGTHGRTGLASVVLGGTAYAILKKCRIPVLAARAQGRKFQM